MKDNDEIMSRISEDFPVLSDEDKDRIFAKSEEKYNSDNITGEQVSGVEPYKKPVINRLVGMAAALAVICGMGTAVYMKVRQTAPPETLTIVEDMNEDLSESANETEDDAFLQEIENVVENAVLFEYTLYNPVIIDANPVSFNIVNEDDTDFEPNVFYLVDNFRTIEELKNHALEFMTESYYENSVVNYLGDKSDIPLDEKITSEEFFGGRLYVPSIISYNGRLYTNYNTEERQSFNFDAIPVEIIENNGDRIKVKKIVIDYDYYGNESESEYHFVLVNTENGWRVDNAHDEDISTVSDRPFKNAEELIRSAILFVQNYTLETYDENSISFHIVNSEEDDVSAYAPEVFYPIKDFKSIDDLKNHALDIFTEEYYENLMPFIGDKSNFSQEETINAEEFFGENYFMPCIISYNGMIYTNSIGHEPYDYDFDSVPFEMISDDGYTKNIEKTVITTTKDGETLETVYYIKAIKTDNGWRIIDLTINEGSDMAEQESEEIPKEIKDDIIKSEDVRFDYDRAFDYERAREIINKQNEICHEIEDNLDETDFVEYEIEPYTHAKYLRYTGSRYSSIDEIMADFDDIFTDEYMRNANLIPNEKSDIHYDLFIEDKGHIYENIARTVSFADPKIINPFEMSDIGGGIVEARYKLDDYQYYIMNLKFEDSKYKLDSDHYVYSKGAALFLDGEPESESAKLTIKNNTDSEITYDMGFTLEKNIDGEWTVINHDQYFNALAGVIQPYGSDTFTAHFVTPLDSGEYRITKDISGEKYFVEFTIE